MHTIDVDVLLKQIVLRSWCSSLIMAQDEAINSREVQGCSAVTAPRQQLPASSLHPSIASCADAHCLQPSAHVRPPVHAVLYISHTFAMALAQRQQETYHMQVECIQSYEWQMVE